MIDALVAGKIFGTPVERTTRSGNRYVTAKVRAPTRDGESQFVNIVGFSNTVVAALLALDDGDAIACAGELTAKAYTSTKDGAPKPSLEVLAHHVLTQFHVTRRREAMKPTSQDVPAETRDESSGRDPELDDDASIPF